MDDADIVYDKDLIASVGKTYVKRIITKEEHLMRLDKYLKVSRIIKRRTVANEACSMGRVTVNDKVAKPAADVNPGT